MNTPPSKPWEQFSQPSAPDAGDGPWSQFAHNTQNKPKRSLWTAINDTVIEGANAAAGTASAIGNFVRPGNVASQWIDKNIIEAGEARQTDVVKAEKQRYAQEMQSAQGVGDEVSATLGYVARNPLLAAAQAAGSFAGPGLTIKGANKLAQAAGLGAKATSRAGLAAGAGFGAAAAGGDAAGTAYDLAREGGATDEQAVAAARDASVIPAAIGAAGGLVGAERLVAGAKGFGGGLVSRALKTGAVEGAQEAVEEGVTQYEGQRAAMPFNPGLDPMKGVAGAATMGAVLGAATGAGASLLTRDSQAPVRKPSEDLGLDPGNGPLSKVAAAAVDEGRAAAPMQPAQPEGGLSLQPVEQPETPAAPSMAERLEALPQQARTQADQLLREIADERTPEGVKRFRANELQQLLDANPMPQVPSMDISQEDRIAMGPIVRGFDPSTGQAPARPLELVDAQPQYEGGIDFEQQPQAVPSSLIQLAEWYERSAQGNRDAANPVDQVQQQVRQGTQYTDAAQVQAARQAVEDAWLSLNAGESVSQAQADGGPGVEAAPADLTAETNARLRAGRVASGVRNAFDDGAPNTLRVIQYVNQGLRTIGEQPLTSPEIARIRRLADARTTFAGLNQPAPLPADRQTTPTDTAADNSSMESLIPVRRAAAQSTTTQQGNANGTAAPFDNAPQTVAPSPAQSQAPAPAFPQPAGVADATQATQAQQTGAQPQAPGAATAEGAGQAAPAQATPVERKRSAGDLARSRSYAANPMRAFLGKHGVSLNSRSEFAPGLQELRGTLVPGYGPMFRKSGKPLDTLAQNAVEEGFLPEGATESDLYELIDRAVRRGERVAPMYTESAAESEFEAMAARQAEFAREDYEADRAAQDAEAAEYDAVLAQEFVGLNDEQLAELDASAPDLDAGSNTTTEAAMRALGFSEKEIQDAVAREQGVAPEARQRGSEAVQADTRGAQARTGASQGDALQSYTEAELKQRQEAQEKAEAEAAKAEREAAAKEKAERERKEISARQAASAENFELGQDPMASLSGQTSIFDAPPQPVVQAAPAQPQQAQDAAEINAEARQGNAAMFSRTERPVASKTTAVQMRRAMVQRTVGSLTQGWGQSPRITVVDSMNDPRVPEAVREADQAQRSQGATGEPEGFWYQGQVYLVASALPTSADATRVLYHEVLGHHGLRGRFGAELDKVLDQVAKLRPKDVAAKASEYGLDMGNPDHVAYAAEEVLAELAQTRPDLGFVQRAIAAIRNFLRSHVPGFKALALTDADIVQGYLLPARGWVERSGNTGNGPRAAGTPFSRNATAVEDRNLVVVHNLSASNLMHAEELGGLAVPSLAIARVDAPLDGFGEITLVGDSAMATPGAKNPVFDADVYSPRFPSVSVKVNEAAVRKALEPLQKAAEAKGQRMRNSWYTIEDMQRNKLGTAISSLSYDTGARLGYAAAVLGKDLSVPMKSEQVSAPATGLMSDARFAIKVASMDLSTLEPGTPESKSLAKALNSAQMRLVQAMLGDKMNTDEGFKKWVGGVSRRLSMYGSDTTIDDDGVAVLNDLSRGGIARIKDLAKNSAAPEQSQSSETVDFDALRNMLDREVPREQMDAWLHEQLSPAMGERRVEKENGRTAAYTLENIVREMTRKVRDSEGFNYGLGNARSRGATKFKNLRQIQGQRDRVVPREQFEAARKELEAEFEALTEAVTPFQRYERDSAFELLAEAIGNSYTMPMERALEQSALIGVPEALRTRISAFGAALVNAPTEYFEAKPQRAVQFNEFRGAVIPSDTTPEVREVLERSGLQLQEYKSGDAEGRRAAVGRLAEQLNADKGDVLFSRSQPADAIRSSMGSLTADQERKASWAAPSASQWDDLTYKLQDKHIDTKRVLESIRATGKAIGDDLDVYLQEELYHGRAAKRTEDFVAQELEPLVRYMSGAGLKMPELEEFLHARHAKEANAVIAQRNPDLPDGGSGMTNAEADAVMAAYSPTKRSLLGKAAEKVDAIIAQTRQTFVEYGLESQDTVDAWGQTFAHYVPLMREQEGDGMAGLGTGQGFSVKGKEVKGRTGSTKKVVDILANIAMQRERAIVRGEKNRVAAALVGLAKANPSGFWKVDVVPTRQVLGKDGMVKTEHDPLYKQRDNVVVAKIPEVDAKTGKVVVKEHAVLFDENDARALRMAQALKNLDAAQLEGMLGATAKVTRYLAAINTQYNPIFGVTNLVRDLQGAAINLQSTELAGRHGEVLAQSLPALRGIYSEMRAQRKGETTGTPWSQLWEEFQGVGGQTGYRDQFRTSADRGEAIEKALDPGSWADSGLGKLFTANGALKVPMEFARQKAQWLFQWLEDYNTAMENGVRLATYKAGLDAGLSKERAASIAKNLTTNFNRKGQVAQQVGALYAFFNASMQGTARIGQAIFTMEPGKPKTMRLSPLGKKVVFGGVTLGVMQALLLAAAGFDEEEPQEFVRERNLIIPVGGKKYITIPMPLGLHVLPNLGRIPAEFAMGGFQNPSATAIKVMSLFADAFNPMGSAGLSMQTLVPTVLDPLAALAENKDFSGRSIAKESFNQATPGHALGRDSASALATWVAQAINFLSGGTQYVRGEFSPTPDQIEYLVGQATGGVGRELLKLQSTAKGLMDGDEVPPHKVPLLGRFYGDSDTPSAKQATFYGHMDSVRRHAEQVKGLRLDGNASEALAYAASHPEARLAFAARKASQDVQKMRELRRELELQGASKEAIRNMDQRMVQRMELFNELVGRTVGAS